MLLDCRREYGGPKHEYFDTDSLKLYHERLCGSSNCHYSLTKEFQVHTAIDVDSDEKLSIPTCKRARTAYFALQERFCQSDVRHIEDMNHVTVLTDFEHTGDLAILFETPETEFDSQVQDQSEFTESSAYLFLFDKIRESEDVSSITDI